LDRVVIVLYVEVSRFWGKGSLVGLPCNVLDFFCELESSAAQHARVAAHVVVERTKGLRAGVAVERPVAVRGMRETEKRGGGAAHSPTYSYAFVRFFFMRWGSCIVPQDSMLRTTPPPCMMRRAEWWTRAFMWDWGG